MPAEVEMMAPGFLAALGTVAEVLSEGFVAAHEAATSQRPHGPLHRLIAGKAPSALLAAGVSMMQGLDQLRDAANSPASEDAEAQREQRTAIGLAVWEIFGATMLAGALATRWVPSRTSRPRPVTGGADLYDLGQARKRGR